MTLRSLFDRLFRRRRLDRATQAEMQFHLDMEIEAGLRRGLTRSQAERTARLKAGAVSTAIEEVRDQRRLGWLEDAFTDLRQAWTALRRRPGYLLLALGALASAVAVNTLVFTILYDVLLSPLPYPHPERLARLYESSAAQPKFPVSFYQFEQNVRFSQTLEAQALYTQGDLQLTHDQRSETVSGVAITEQFFPLLGAPLFLGRNFTHEEMTDAARVVILSHTFWTTRFHADPAIVGSTLRLDREPWTVIGVAAPGFEHIGGDYRSPLQGDTVAVWRPMPFDSVSVSCSRGCHFTNAIVRLRTGVTFAAATQELNEILATLARDFPNNYANRSARLEPLSTEVVGASRTTVLVLAAAAGCVLLLATINVAGLSIARTLARRRELAVRAALGGGKWQLLRAVVAENAVLGLFAAVLGLAVAAALLPALRALMPPDFPRLHALVLHWPSALFAAATAVGASLLAGLAAGLRYAGAAPADALHEESRTSSGSHRSIRLRGAMAAAQMSLACVLCFTAILLLRSSLALGARDQGFDPAGVLTFELSFPRGVYNDARMTAFFAEAGRRLREIPGVTAAGFGTSVPWTGYDESTYLTVPGYTPREGESMLARYQSASPGFFKALATPILEGRALDDRDTAQAPRAAVINETLARRFFPDRSAVGRTINFFGSAPWTVVGVIADIRDTPSDLTTPPALWMPLAQQPFPLVRGAVRTAHDPAGVLPAVRAAMAAVDAELPVADVRTLASISADAHAERRFTLWWCGAFAALALVLGAVGIYSLLAYSVQQRQREIGIRLALGASRGRVLAALFGSGLALAAVGIALGLLATPAAGRALGSLLYGVSTTDAIALAAAAMSILLAALIASLAPAWTASRTDPMSALREQ